MDRRHGRWLRFRGDLSTGIWCAPAEYFPDRPWADSRVRDPAMGECVRRSSAMEFAITSALHFLFFSGLPQVSSLAALSADDVGSGSDVARVAGTRGGA